jgi:hypothetical protein
MELRHDIVRRILAVVNVPGSARKDATTTAHARTVCIDVAARIPIEGNGMFTIAWGKSA